MRAPLVAIAVLAAGIAAASAAPRPADIKAAEDAAVAADLKARALRHDADTADRRARAAETERAKLAARIQANEAKMTAIERHIAAIRGRQRVQQARLAGKQGEVTRLLGALETLSRRPPALVLFQPQSAVDTARLAAMLSAVRPVLALRTAGLRGELRRTRRLRDLYEGAERRLARVRAAQVVDEQALAAMQAQHRAERDRLDAAADAERERALVMANRALDLRQLARSIERQAVPAANPGRRARHYASVPNAAEAAALDYRLPAAGQVLLGFGARNEVGVRSRGLTLATRGNAQVTAPAAGEVAYAGQFRDYGDIVIIAHDGDMLSLISGLERVDVAVGERVRRGAPIGHMGVVRPKLYLELRDGGRPVDPALWAKGRG